MVNDHTRPSIFWITRGLTSRISSKALHNIHLRMYCKSLTVPPCLRAVRQIFISHDTVPRENGHAKVNHCPETSSCAFIDRRRWRTLPECLHGGVQRPQITRNPCFVGKKEDACNGMLAPCLPHDFNTSREPWSACNLELSSAVIS